MFPNQEPVSINLLQNLLAVSGNSISYVLKGDYFLLIRRICGVLKPSVMLGLGYLWT